MKFGTIYVSKKLGCLCIFADGWKENINQEQWSLCPETSLCAEHEVKAPFFSWSPWNFVCLVCALVVYCSTFFQGLLCVYDSLPKFASYLYCWLFTSPIIVATLGSQQTLTNAHILYLCIYAFTVQLAPDSRQPCSPMIRMLLSSFTEYFKTSAYVGRVLLIKF